MSAFDKVRKARIRATGRDYPSQDAAMQANPDNLHVSLGT